jgi:hypothetical protein
MNVPSPHEFSEELLAAYADGELDSHARCAVEQWLTEHPEALERLRAQREFSATNAFLWQAVEPPEPSVTSWANARRNIELELAGSNPRPVGRGRSPRVAGWVAACLAIGGAAAAVAWVSTASTIHPAAGEDQKLVNHMCRQELSPEVAPFPHTVSPPDPLDAFAVLPMATDDDVVLDRVPDFGEGWLPVGQHPVPGVIALAMVEDLVLEEVTQASSGSKMTNAPGDAPMIYAAKPR